MRPICTLAVLSLSALVASAGDVGWTPIGDPIDSFGNVTFIAENASAQGIRIRIATPDGRHAVQLEPETLSVPATNGVSLLLKFRPEAWSLFHQDRCLTVIPAPFPLPAVVSQPAAGRPSGESPRIRFQKVADFRFEDSFMRPEDTENPLGEWEPGSSNWFLHGVEGLAISGDPINPAGRRPLKSDFSPNFYSLAGKGIQEVITAGYDFYDDYSFEAGVRVGPGEMGLLFYARESGAAHAFTVSIGEGEEALLTVWNRASTNSPRHVLAAAAVTTSPGQWVKLRVKVLQNRVQCFMDAAKVFDLPLDLPPGGKFGLYVDSQEEVRFDDVAAESNHDLDFVTVGDLRRYVLGEHGAFFPRRRFYHRSEPGAGDLALTPAVSRRPQWLALGSVAHGPHVFEAAFEPASLPFGVGVLAGYQSDGAPYYRFTCLRTKTDETFQLERVSGETGTVLEALRLPLQTGVNPTGPVTLMFDASRDNEWRLYRNGVLVLVHVPAPAAPGGSGLYVAENTRVRIAVPSYRFKREELFLNRYEKNSRFSTDPFMRHWASPEGQWLSETNGQTWYTGDFFGRFSLRMPYVESSEIHLGVGENETNGAVVVAVAPGSIRLLKRTGVMLEEPTRAQIATNGLVADDGTNAVYTVHHEGHWVWLTSGTGRLARLRLDRPLEGRRIRVAGFTTDQLKATTVERFNVKDYLFTESLFDWIINGGRWEVVNRFQCDPRWSHMNGEVTNGLAALWTKLEIGGDFCVEMHAGQRHGWYDRCGDMNLTVMNRDTTPSQGYSISCTGWDPDHSQLFTTLYRNGVAMARSDAYLLPRKREGNRRLGYEPLVAAGRDVHGAWYYLKFRRVGRKLELFFDNELVFSAIDEQPLNSGSAGIWTFLNSMMVARVKVAAERIGSRPLAIRPVPLDAVDAWRSRDAVPARPAETGSLLNHGRPLCLMQPAYWKSDDPVSPLRLEWHETAGSGIYFTARNRSGSGNMTTASALPPTPFPDLAGWRFEVKRTADARFDFHFSAGHSDAAGVYTAQRRFVHRLSGTAPLKGPIMECGRTDVPAAGDLESDRSPWTTVTVWLPRDWTEEPKARNLEIRVEGFGLLHPSFDQQGLTGNTPGAAYAVRNFTEIRYGLPVLSVATNRPPPAAFVLRDPSRGRSLGRFGSVTALQARIEAASGDGLSAVTVQPAGNPPAAPIPLAWIRLPDRPAMAVSWHDGKPDTVAFRGEAAYPDPRFFQAEALIGETRPAWVTENYATRSAAVPRLDAYGAEHVPVTVTLTDSVTRFSLAWNDNPVRNIPVLLSLAGLTPFLANGETQDPASGIPAANPGRLKLAAYDPEQGAYFEAQNTLRAKRLRCAMPATVSLARHPYFQFRYRTTDPMARVSLGVGNSRFARISEAYANAFPVRLATDLVMDGRWHTWLGQVSDAVGGDTFTRNLFQITEPALGSAHPVDQTGLFSQWELDDLVFGPAVSSAAQLAVTPTFFDFGGIESVQMAIWPGPEPYDTLAPSQATSLVWRTITNRVEAVPPLEGLVDGPHHLLLKARGTSGRESRVTDIPFLLDRQPPQGSAHFAGPTGSPAPHGPYLRVTWQTGGGAPLDPQTLKFKWEGLEISAAMPDTRLLCNPGSETLVFNWAYYFRDQLSQTTNGQQATILLAGIQDGAGNVSPDVAVPVTLDYTKDREPPARLSVRYPTNIFWRTAWDTEAERTPGFTGRSGLQVELVRGTNEPPFLRVSGTNGVIQLATNDKPGWRVEAFPYLALRIRRPIVENPGTPVSLSLALGFSRTNTVIVPLIAMKRSPRHYILSEPIDWRSNVWQSVFLDLADMVKDRVPTQSLATLTVKSLSIHYTTAAAVSQFHVQSVYAYGPGSPRDRVRIENYDVSGLDPIGVDYETPDGRLIDPTAFANDPGAVCRPPRAWALLYARDKAGNSAAPIRVPVWSAQPPAGDR